jgi:DNA-binding beta-propeller fold protein YncE
MQHHNVLIASTLGLVLAACGGNGSDPPDAPSRAVIVAGNYKDMSVLSTLDLATDEVKPDVGPAAAVGIDPMLRHYGSELFVVNRFPDHSVAILDDQTLALKEQINLGDDSNPQDVAVLGNKLYVATLGTKGVTVVTRGSAVTTEIDLSADDPDLIPDCNSIYAVDNKLYVSCGLLDGFAAVRPGKVYVVDPATRAVVPGLTVTLVHKNPFGLFERIPAGAPHAGDLVISTVEDFATPGCVERFTPGATPGTSSCMVAGADLAGYPTRIAFDGAASVMFLAVTTTFPDSDLRAFDMPTDSLWAGALNPAAQAIGDVVVCPDGSLVVADKAEAANGFRVYVSSAEQTTAALPIGLETFSTHGLVCY